MHMYIYIDVPAMYSAPYFVSIWMAGISSSLHADNVFVYVQLRNGIRAKILI